MKIKKGDQVKVITGKYKGTIGEVLQVFPKEDKVIVEGVNIAKKHLKPSQQNPDGGIVEKLLPIHVSNVMAYDSKKKEASRIGYTVEKGEKVRVYKKTGNKVK
jgi:large subunit ribosomal protein L24